MNNIRDNRRVISGTRALDEYSAGVLFVERIIILTIIIVIPVAITATTSAERHYNICTHTHIKVLIYIYTLYNTVKYTLTYLRIH